MAEIYLYAPNNSRIVGIKLKDESYSILACVYNRRFKTIIYQLPRNNIEKLFKATSGDYILKDELGIEWPSTDVEFYSLGKG